MNICLTYELSYLKDHLETLGHIVANNNDRNIYGVIHNLKNQ